LENKHLSNNEDRFSQLKSNIELGVGSINKNIISLIELVELYRKENLELLDSIKKQDKKSKDPKI
jgi:hypothetical protein